MNFNKSAFINSNKMKLGVIRDRYTTFRSLGSLLDNYCLIASLPIDIEYQYGIMAVCSIELSTDAKYEKQDFSFRVYFNNGVKCVINTGEESLLFKVYGDVLENKFNIYIKSNAPGATFNIDVLYGTNLGFATFYDKTQFAFNESSFTKKISATVKKKKYNEEIILDGGASALPFRIQRNKESGIFNQLVAYVSNNGEAAISRNKNNTETVGDYDTAIFLGENKVSIDLPAGGSFSPSRDSSNMVGDINNKWKRGYYSDGVSISRTSAPINPDDPLTFFYAPNKKLITYYNGKYYDAMGNEINI